MADLSVCRECGGVDGCLDTCKWMAPHLALRAKEAQDKRDLDLLGRLRAHPLTGSVVCDLEAGAKRSSGGFVEVLEMAAQLLRGNV